MIYSIYNKTTGKILRIVQTDIIDRQLGKDEDYIENSYDNTKYYINNNEVVEIPPKPSVPYVEFDYTTKSWVVNPIISRVEILFKRKQLLDSSDWTDTLSAKTRLDETLYNQWQTYRQQLRDITTQAGYPLNVTWPTQPGSTPTT
jgi:hypothetical protein